MSAKLTAFRNLFGNIAKLDSDKLFKKVLTNDKGLQQDILDLNRIDQLYDKGIRADETSLGRYSKLTKEIKISKDQVSDHVTLKDTGEFYGSFRIKAEATDVIITADTIKPDVDLAEKYGDNILGLTQESKARMIGWLKAPFVNEMRKAIFK